MKAKNDLSVSYIKSRLIYDPKTGVFTWKKYSKHGPQWNNRFAGKSAGCIHKKRKYLSIKLDGRSYLGHRIAWVIVKGKWPKDEIDHKNSQPWISKLKNLREANHQQNSRNTKRQSNTISGYKGVAYHSNGRFKNKWEARIGHNGKGIYLGCFGTARKAHIAYCNAAKKYHGKFARFE